MNPDPNPNHNPNRNNPNNLLDTIILLDTTFGSGALEGARSAKCLLLKISYFYKYVRIVFLHIHKMSLLTFTNILQKL